LPDLKVEIAEALAGISLPVTAQQLDQFERYLRLLDKWNHAYNLTAVRDIHEMVDRHLVDSLSIAPYLEGERLIDIGSGAGLPGIPLAILYPEKTIHLLDSNQKKGRFLIQVKHELGLANVTVVTGRAEGFQPERRFDGVISRAFAELKTMLEVSAHLCCPSGKFYAMKGQYPAGELQGVEKPYKVRAIHWPGNRTERHLVIISQEP